MNLYKCTHCGQLLYFENDRCEKCGHSLGFVAKDMQLVPLTRQENGLFTIYNETGPKKRYRYYANHLNDIINDIINMWLPLPFAMNSLNRSMRHRALYPFMIPPKVVEN